MLAVLAARSARRFRRHALRESTRALVGGNLPLDSDFGRDERFVNLLHTTRAFAAVGGDNFSYDSVACDSNGWPQSDFVIVLPKTLDSVGTEDYAFGCTGDASGATLVTSQGWTWATAPTYNAGTNRTQGVLRAPNGVHNQPVIQFNNTKRTSGSATNTGVTDIEINRPGFAADGTAPRYNPAWVTWVSDMCGFVRSMDWEGTNHDVSTTSWAQEPSATNRRVISHGHFPTQFVTDLAAQAGLGAWLHIKTAADDQFITDKATWLRDNTPATMQLTIELGNEEWNQSFGQRFYIFDQVCNEVDGWHGQGNLDGTKPNRRIMSIVRASNVLTVTTRTAHGYTVGTVLYCLSVGATNGARTIESVPSATTFTFADTGSDSTTLVNGGSTVVRLRDQDLNGYDQSYDITGNLCDRWVARRTCQISTLFRAVFGDAAMHSRVNIVLQMGTGNDCAGPLGYITARMPQPANYYLKAIGNGWYVFFNGTTMGGADLRNVNTYNGNTPPSIDDYITCLGQAVDGAKIGNVNDGVAIQARLHNLEVWKYEIGFDLNAVPTNLNNSTTYAQKLLALFDPRMKELTKRLINDYRRFGFKNIAWYTFGTVPPGAAEANTSWPVAYDIHTASPRRDALIELMTDPQPGCTRNLVAATGATVLDGRSRRGQFPTDWPTGNTTYTQAATTFAVTTFWLIAFEATQTRTLTVNVTTTSSGRSFYVYWNGVQVGGLISPTNGLTQDFSFSVTGTKDNNVLELRANGFVGTFITVNSLTFEAP